MALRSQEEVSLGDQQRRAHILFLCHPLTGHITPALRVASELHRRGWPVSFLAPTKGLHSARISAAGIDFIPLEGEADIDDIAYYSPDNPNPPVPGYHSLPWYERGIVDWEQHCLNPIPAQWACVKEALASLHAKDSERPVVVICEALFHGILPLHFGAQLPDGVRRPKTLCLSVTPPIIRSIDLPPFGFPLPFDQSPDGRARNDKCWTQWAERTAALKGLFDAKLTEAGASQLPTGPILDGVNYTSHDTIMQIGVPSFEYPRSDWPEQFQFIGFLPLAQPPSSGYSSLPSWWDDIVNATDKKIVVVAQGTVETDPNDLIIPTIKALQHRTDVLVVAVMGRRGAMLPSDMDVPKNARVVDYLNYDVVLQYAHAWVHNGGYGAITHGIAHGVPMVVAGEGQDKPENVKRVRFSGIGVGLGTPRPGVSDLRSSLDAILDDPKFRSRVEKLRQEALELDSFGRVEKAVIEALR